MKALRIIMGWGLLCLAVLSLQGQTAEVFRARVQDIVQKTRLMIGPLRVYPVLKFSNFSWVSNIFGYSNTLAKTSDLLITPSPEVQGHILFRNLFILSFIENPEYNFYLSNSAYRGFTNSYRAEVHILLFNRMIVSGRYDHSAVRYLGYQELDRVVQNAMESYSVRIFSQSSRGTSLTLEARRSRLNFRDVLAQGVQISPLLDRDETMGSAELGYRLFSATKFFLRGAYTQYKFPRQPSFWGRSTSFEVLAGLQLPGTSMIRGSVAMGFKKFAPNKGPTQGFAGIIGNAALEFRFENFGVFRLTLNRNNSFSLSEEFLYYVDHSVDGHLIFRLVGPFYMRLGGHYGLLDYPQQAAEIPNQVGGAASVRDIYSHVSGGFIVRFSPTFGIGLTYQRWLRVSRLFGADFQGHLITADIVRSF